MKLYRWTCSMLSAQGQAFLEKHKRRRYVSDLEFVQQHFEQIGISPVKQLLRFQAVFGGYVSPARCGQHVWGLAISEIPEDYRHDGTLLTPCSDDVEHGPRIDTQGRYYPDAYARQPVASSCFVLFEQMALIVEWEANQDSEPQLLVADCRDVGLFHRTVIPLIDAHGVGALSDQYSRLYVSEWFVIRTRDDGATAWFVPGRLPDGVIEHFPEPRQLKRAPNTRFADRVRSLFCDPAQRMIY